MHNSSLRRISVLFLGSALVALASGRCIGDDTLTQASEVKGDAANEHKVIRLRDICRVKGQHRILLQAVGVVIGLDGTGDGDFAATARKLEESLANLGLDQESFPIGEAAAKSSALVWVTAEVPPLGVQQGDEIDCTVTAVSTSSLRGGTLLLTPLSRAEVGAKGGGKTDVWAVAQGQVHLNDDGNATSGKVSLGCQLQRDVIPQIVKDNKLILVVKPWAAEHCSSSEIEILLNGSPDLIDSRRKEAVASAVTPTAVEVRIPGPYRDHLEEFIELLMSKRVPLWR